MARPTKFRRVCHIPYNLEFSPSNSSNDNPIILTVDEYEVIRLIDKEGLSQEECGIQLGVGRTTAQKIYDIARKKIAEALVCGLVIKIEGGDYHLCNGSSDYCYKDECFKKEYLNKGEHIMRIAVTYQNGKVFQHFGHTEQFKIYDVVENKIVESSIVDTNGSGHGALAGFLSTLKVDVLICGGIGGGAQVALRNVGIKIYGGVNGNADDAINALLNGKLEFNPNVMCNHHGHDHKEHSCASHSCGKGKC